MHLAQFETAPLPIGGGVNGVAKMPVQSNGFAKSLEESRREVERDMLQVNEVFIPVPPGLVETIMAAWILLVQRYQRDAFQSFSWGAEGAELQTISAAQLELERVETVADLLVAVRRAMSKDVTCQHDDASPCVLVFNDGPKDEVCITTRNCQGE